jgi:hypothetical protein
MTKYLLAIAVGIVFLLWVVILLPGWILGMMYAGQVMLVPDAPKDADFWRSLRPCICRRSSRALLSIGL